MYKLPNGLSALLYACLVCFVGLVMPIKALAVSALPATKAKSNLTTRLAHRIVQKRLMRAAVSTDEICAILLKRDSTEVPIVVISRSNATLTYYLCDDAKKRLQSIPYDAILAVRMPSGSLWRPKGVQTREQGRRGHWGLASLSLSIFGLLATSLPLGAILCTAGIFVGVTGLIRHTKQRWAAILGIVLGAVPLILGLAGAIPLAIL